ncbi:hypothetical protein NX722_07955 [Endozoicomonas gorgoniicola]|uniref:Uncharacterized protein n=1 Tax=Endozoicomonas gorgoniicola TaxID=1234144 RepID=A0ABT3MU31_9GAMM|nr:hypothetical protein [Endozoicomonas gorgoniicola]MCW7552583.1 hypothetical protein [Endozoicomonas gorgoniicola]
MDKQEKKREAARLRKRKQRERQRAWKQARGAENLNLEIYKGTRACLEELMTGLDYTEQAEVITRLIHGAHRLMERDKSQIEEFLKV